MNASTKSIFQQYYTPPSFVDRYLEDADQAVDVIIPVIHTNELWRANLLSFYREIPVNKLLIGDGGCIDDSMEIAKEFPRVQILNHREYKSLGYSIRKMIESVETDWFIYVHSDAFLPQGWFDAMKKNQPNYEWFGCPMQHTVMVEYDMNYGNRPWAGSQMGLKKAFVEGLKRIDDDYVYRQEDFVFAEIVKKAGFREGKITDTFHYHQTIRKPSRFERKVISVDLQLEIGKEEEARAAIMQIKGLVKYLDPDPGFVSGIVANMDRLEEMQEMKWPEFLSWVQDTNPAWYPLISHEAKKTYWRAFVRSTITKIKKIMK